MISLIEAKNSPGHKHRGTGCFLVGSGPSLNQVDVARLAQINTISFNRSYVAWERWGFAPTLYACLDPAGLPGNALEIRDLIEVYPGTHFFLHESAHSFGIRPSIHVSLVGMTSGHSFSEDILALTDFGNVGATSIQILKLLGYKRVAMVGVDAQYNHIHDKLVSVQASGFALIDEDPDHFCSEYGRGKTRLAFPDLDKILGQWPAVAKECERNSIAVRNASSGSALECFPKTDFDSAIEWVLRG